PELGRDLLEHRLDQRDVVEAGAEPLEAVYREVEHSPPSFERAGRVSCGDGSTRTVERTGALASAGSAATSDGACTVSSAIADDGVASRRNVTAPSKRSQRKNVTPAPGGPCSAGGRRVSFPPWGASAAGRGRDDRPPSPRAGWRRRRRHLQPARAAHAKDVGDFEGPPRRRHGPRRGPRGPAPVARVSGQRVFAP